MRLFVALELPSQVRTALADWADAAAPPVVRRVEPDNLHVTLAFLGSRDEDDALAVGRLLPARARKLARLQTAGALWLPPRRPGVLTVALLADDGLPALQADLVAVLRSAIGFEPEARPFRPHITVGRVPRGTPVDTRDALREPAPALTFQAHALTLFRSHTSGGDARYEPLARTVLP